MGQLNQVTQFDFKNFGNFLQHFQGWSIATLFNITHVGSAYTHLKSYCFLGETSHFTKSLNFLAKNLGQFGVLSHASIVLAEGISLHLVTVSNLLEY